MHYDTEIDDDDDRNINIKIDQTMSKETIDHLINTKVSRLNKKKNRPNLGYEIRKNDKQMVQGILEDYKLHIDYNLLNKLFAKISYEFICTCIGEKYLDDSLAKILKKIIIDEEEHNRLPKECEYQLTCDKRMLYFYVNKIAEVANENTWNIYYNKPLVSPSNGNFIHKITLIQSNNKLILKISLFNTFNCKMCVSNDGPKYNFKKGEIICLIMGMHNNKPLREINTPYQELKINFYE